LVLASALTAGLYWFRLTYKRDGCEVGSNAPAEVMLDILCPEATERSTMMVSRGTTELLIILLIVIVVFGAKRPGGIGSALGGSLRDFKRAVRDDPGTVAQPAETPHTS
jgi:sec-independent protein translocase protein TatA